LKNILRTTKSGLENGEYHCRFIFFNEGVCKYSVLLPKMNWRNHKRNNKYLEGRIFEIKHFM